jgi:hypothetical protein
MADSFPILAASGGSAADASRSSVLRGCERYRLYDASPAPWWVTALWLAFFVCAFTYLMVHLLSLG